MKPIRILSLLAALTATTACSRGTTESVDATFAIVYGTVTVDDISLHERKVVAGYSSDCTEHFGGFSDGGVVDPEGNYRVGVTRLTGEGTVCVAALIELASGDTLRATGTAYFRHSQPYDSVRIDLGPPAAANRPD